MSRSIKAGEVQRGGMHRQCQLYTYRSRPGSCSGLYTWDAIQNYRLRRWKWRA
jgi:hypothetical protein